jgi:hypothetical protein
MFSVTKVNGVHYSAYFDESNQCLVVQIEQGEPEADRNDHVQVLVSFQCRAQVNGDVECFRLSTELCTPPASLSYRYGEVHAVVQALEKLSQAFEQKCCQRLCPDIGAKEEKKSQVPRTAHEELHTERAPDVFELTDSTDSSIVISPGIPLLTSGRDEFEVIPKQVINA